MNIALDVDAIRRGLATRSYGNPLVVAATTSSTNDDAKRAIAGGCTRGHVVIANAQSAGRGSHGRSWVSPAGVNIYLSIAERWSPVRPMPTLLTLAVGLGVADALHPLCDGALLGIKWPNDVLLARKKVAGVLVEGSTRDGEQTAVIGIGVNVNQREFDPSLAATATSLALHTGREYAREPLIASLLACVERWVDEAGTSPARVAAAVRLQLIGIGERCRFDGAEVTIRGINDDGALLVEDAHGHRAASAGRILLPDG